jgi:phosphoribosylaminoimidazolecarboxamide formyltransferase/IMP cyclohydrolase
VATTPAQICAVCFIKHTNACGVAVAAASSDRPEALRAARVDAYRRAYVGDPNAAMGGILAVNFPVDAALAAAVMETYARWGKPLTDAGHPAAPRGFFLEVWLAREFTEDAIAVIRGTYDPAAARPEPAETAFRDAARQGAAVPRKDWGQRVRLLAVGDLGVAPDPRELVYRSIAGGMLVQTRDLLGINEEQWKVVTQRQPTPQELSDLRLAWLICKHTKSNAITVCRDGMLIGNGAGQMSRMMSCRIATWLAQENGHAEALRGAVAASDAFFPFRDGPDILMDAGVTALIQPGGSKRDDDTIAACNARGAAMLFTGTRHFKH